MGWLASYCHAVWQSAAVEAAEVLRKVLKMLSDSFDLFALVPAFTLTLTSRGDERAAGECRQQKPLDSSENRKRTTDKESKELQPKTIDQCAERVSASNEIKFMKGFKEREIEKRELQ